ncbi:amino acid abc transporter permease protein 3-tm domain [Trichococcus palustris]|jgi:aspartate/glutamate/glutamine transport system permease protein|uniref:Amino acid abc transporter permease protein 3-tm domain n=1 Tax=Trichococcus palustris TaxID=140314 RepID=A0A143YUG4_9LACT|nr:amino acid ABC transporter permease [Trichococcus palustris]CZQ97883.1 amino acid abc transporter permease protein 3-tm domain [Trichococcus palustris]SFL15000.1 putative glutamine transport system permease protein [Trichococcus palustris]
MFDIVGALSGGNITYLLKGVGNTVLLSVLAIALSFAVGSVLGIIRFVKIPFLSKILGFLMDVIRSIPLLLIIVVAYFGFPQMGFRFSTFGAALIAFTLFESCMIAEIIRAGLKSVHRGQVEAGLSTGLTYFETLYHIVIPQGFRAMVPSLVSQFVSLIKDTSLTTIISFSEITYRSKIIYSMNSAYVLPMYVVMGILYWVVCHTLSSYSKRYEVAYLK